VALSITKVENRSLVEGVKKLMWFQVLLKELHHLEKGQIFYCHNESNIEMVKNLGVHSLYILTKIQDLNIFS
jgi:hypothetical protein